MGKHRSALSILLGLLACGALIAFGVFLGGCPSPDDSGGGAAVTPSGESSDATDTRELNQQLKDAVVLIEVDLHFPDGTATGTGSGFVVNDRGRIITNAHVVEPFVTNEDGSRQVATGRTVRVVFHPGTGNEEMLQAEVVRENEDLDLALLRVNKDTPTFLDLGDSEAAAEMTKIICAGHPAGLREISLRTGTITAHRTFEGKKWIEHDADAEFGSSGGPIVDEAGNVLGVMTQIHLNRFLASMWAVPSNTLRDWLASDPANDPPVYFASAGTGGQGPGRVQITEGDRPPSTAGTELERLLEETGLAYSYWQNDVWQIEYENAATVYVEEFDDILRAYVIFGDLPSNASLPALAFTFHDPVGRFSVTDENGVDRLYWEAQVPMGVATPRYLRDLCDTGATQIQNFLNYLGGGVLETPTELYPGGDAQAQYAQLARILENSGLIYEVVDEQNFKMPFDNGVDVYVKIFNGVAYFHSYTGGLPGSTDAERLAMSTELLRFNWDDPIGRLAVDEEIDVVWECQVPMSYLTPDYLYIVASVGSNRVAEYWDTFGKIPFNES